jgi:hypothetical protein
MQARCHINAIPFTYKKIRISNEWFLLKKYRCTFDKIKTIESWGVWLIEGYKNKNVAMCHQKNITNNWWKVHGYFNNRWWHGRNGNLKDGNISNIDKWFFWGWYTILSWTLLAKLSLSTYDLKIDWKKEEITLRGLKLKIWPIDYTQKLNIWLI